MNPAHIPYQVVCSLSKLDDKCCAFLLKKCMSVGADKRFRRASGMVSRYRFCEEWHYGAEVRVVIAMTDDIPADFFEKSIAKLLTIRTSTQGVPVYHPPIWEFDSPGPHLTNNR